MEPASNSWQAFLKALPVTVISGIGFGLIAVGHALKGDRSLVGALVVSLALTVVMFLTYFVLARCGYKVDAHGNVNVPRRYSWPLLGAVIAVVMAAALYVAILWK